MSPKLKIKDQPVSRIDTVDDVAVISFQGKENGDFEVQSILNFMNEHRINIDLLMRQEYSDGIWSFSFSCSRGSLEVLKANNFFETYVAKDIAVVVMKDLFAISLIGAGMSTTSGVIKRVFNALSMENIEYYHITTSEISTTITVDKSNSMKAMIALTTEFQL